jgi:hypothetical protein
MRAATDEDALYELELRLVRTARSAGPLRAALARVAARLVETQAWTKLGYARLSDYATERAGMSARSLQDLGLVGGVLSYSETLRGVLESGELPWTKVRLLARVARRRPIEPFLALARRGTAHALAKAVRSVMPDSIEGGGLDEPRWKSLEIPCSREVYAKWETALWLARRVCGVDGGAAYPAEAIAAEVLSAIPFEQKLADEPEEEDRDVRRIPSSRRSRASSRRRTPSSSTRGCARCSRASRSWTRRSALSSRRSGTRGRPASSDTRRSTTTRASGWAWIRPGRGHWCGSSVSRGPARSSRTRTARGRSRWCRRRRSCPS